VTASKDDASDANPLEATLSSDFDWDDAWAQYDSSESLLERVAVQKDPGASTYGGIAIKLRESPDEGTLRQLIGAVARATGLDIPCNQERIILQKYSNRGVGSYHLSGSTGSGTLTVKPKHLNLKFEGSRYMDTAQAEEMARTINDFENSDDSSGDYQLPAF